MFFIKKVFVALALFSSAMYLTACQNQSNVIAFTTLSPTMSFNAQNQTAIVNVVTQDLRSSAEVASFVSSGNTQRFTAVPDVRQLFQQAMQQNLNSKGFRVVSGAGNVNLLVNVNKFFAQVEQGNIRHKINVEIAVDVIAQGSKGQATKHFNTIRTAEGVLNADSSNISAVLNQAYSEMVQSIYNDNELGQIIHQIK